MPLDDTSAMADLRLHDKADAASLAAHTGSSSRNGRRSFEVPGVVTTVSSSVESPV